MQLKSVSWWHEQLADWMLLNPDRSLKEAALVFNCSVNYVYMIKNSDAFQAYWHFRRSRSAEKVEDKAIGALGGLSEKLAAVADMALDQMLEDLEKNGKLRGTSGAVPELDHGELRATSDAALKRLGYGLPSAPKAGGGTQATQVNVLIDSNMLAEAREKMRQLHGVTTAPAVEAAGGRAEVVGGRLEIEDGRIAGDAERITEG